MINISRMQAGGPAARVYFPRPVAMASVDDVDTAVAYLVEHDCTELWEKWIESATFSIVERDYTDYMRGIPICHVHASPPVLLEIERRLAMLTV